MRISEQALARSALYRLNLRMEDMATVQEQLSTGRRINKPSDDIALASRALTLHSQQHAGTQAQRNADDGMLWVNLADTKLQGDLPPRSGRTLCQKQNPPQGAGVWHHLRLTQAGMPGA